jgi:tRNA (guanine37-N1)-methyltransferase
VGRHWHDALDLAEEVLDQVPRGYDVVGDVAIVRLPEAVREHETAVGRALVEEVPPASTAAVDEGVEGRARTRSLRVIGGEGTLVTEHKENGCRLLVDLQRTYFSPRLAHERARVADQVREGERVLDLYTGVAPYPVLVAKRGAGRVLGVDLNPRAVELARENADRNKVADRVDVVLADGEALAPSLAGSFDRIVMNLPHSAREHLDAVLSALAEDGRVHLAALLPKDDAEEQARVLADEHGFTLVELVDVRPYNPAVGHYTLDLER